MPSAFAFDDKANMIWLIYGFGWDKITVQPEFKDLIVSYKVLHTDGSIKSGRIAIKNNEHTKGLRFYQTWKSAVSEFLTQYDEDIANMTKAFVNQLNQEL